MTTPARFSIRCPNEMFGKLKKDYEPERDRGFLRRLYLGPGPPNLPRPSQDDEAQLRTKVSKEARDMLAKVSAEERSQVIQRWMGAAVFSRMRTNPSTEELQAFQESLTQERTDSLGEPAPRPDVPGAALPVQPATIRGLARPRIPLGTPRRQWPARTGGRTRVRRATPRGSRRSATVGFSRETAPRLRGAGGPSARRWTPPTRPRPTARATPLVVGRHRHSRRLVTKGGSDVAR